MDREFTPDEEAKFALLNGHTIEEEIERRANTKAIEMFHDFVMRQQESKRDIYENPIGQPIWKINTGTPDWTYRPDITTTGTIIPETWGNLLTGDLEDENQDY